MSAFDIDKVSKVAKLSRIKVNDEEKQKMAKELDAIMSWIEQLSEVNVEGIEPVSSVSGSVLPFRKDEVTAGNQPEDVLKNAPDSKHYCYSVPKVIDQG